jgi:signal peptidase I
VTRAGRVAVDGKALTEDYLPPGVAPSDTDFAVSLGPGQLWVMGDNRAVAADSRYWGPVPMSDIKGRALWVLHNGRATQLRTPATFTAEGLAPADHRIPLPLVLLYLSAVAIAQRLGPHDHPDGGL